MYSIKVVEYVAYLYLRSLSFNQVIAILRAFYEQDVFTKNHLIDHIEQLADRIPNHYAISQWLKPKRGGYYALDGTWLKYRSRDIVLLILFDVETLDVVSYMVARDETEETYSKLIELAKPEITDGVKGFFCDGELGLVKALKNHFRGVPLQLCVFHKYQRVHQLVPFIRPKTKLDKDIKERVGQILFALAFVWFYTLGYEPGKAGLAQGLRYGIYVGILLGAAQGFVWYVVLPIPFSLNLAWIGSALLNSVAAGFGHCRRSRARRPAAAGCCASRPLPPPAFETPRPA